MLLASLSEEDAGRRMRTLPEPFSVLLLATDMTRITTFGGKVTRAPWRVRVAGPREKVSRATLGDVSLAEDWNRVSLPRLLHIALATPGVHRHERDPPAKISQYWVFSSVALARTSINVSHYTGAKLSIWLNEYSSKNASRLPSPEETMEAN